VRPWTPRELTYPYPIAGDPVMMPEPSARNFKDGSWDLRKRDRRQSQVAIPFPDRRLSERRSSLDSSAEPDSELTWVAKPRWDE
jgi:hypothetical protein